MIATILTRRAGTVLWLSECPMHKGSLSEAIRWQNKVSQELQQFTGAVLDLPYV